MKSERNEYLGSLIQSHVVDFVNNNSIAPTISSDVNLLKFMSEYIGGKCSHGSIDNVALKTYK